MKKMKMYISIATALVASFVFVTAVSARGTQPTTGATYVVDDDSAECPHADFTNIPDALAAASDGDLIKVCAGNYDGDYLTKSVNIRGVGEANIINGPLHSSGRVMGFRLLAGSDGAKIQHLNFDVDFPIMNGEGVNDVVIYDNTLTNPIQGISNWTGNNWYIYYNTITDLRSTCGGGIGILVGDYSGTESRFNRVTHNTITGTLHVDENDCGGYDGTGIVIFADHRYGRVGGDVSNNLVSDNTISLVSDTPAVVDVNAIELTDTRDDLTQHDVVNNTVRYNDVSGTASGIVLTPENLDEFNSIYNNTL